LAIAQKFAGRPPLYIVNIFFEIYPCRVVNHLKDQQVAKEFTPEILVGYA